jgi:hypothetical protein
MADEQIIQQVGQLLVNAILTDTARRGFATLIQDTYLDPVMISKTGGFLSAAINTDYVRDTSTDIGFMISQRVLSDPAVIGAARAFVAAVLRV